MFAGILLISELGIGVAMFDSGMSVYFDSIVLKSSPRMVSSTISFSTILSIASLLFLQTENQSQLQFTLSWVQSDLDNSRIDKA